jgi:hypothetical protein
MKTRAHPLTAQERRIVAILYDDWRDLLRCTTIDQAMERSGVSFSQESRLHIAEFLRRDPAAVKLMRWDLAVYVLTNEEKLFARLAMRSARDGIIPNPDDIAAASVEWWSAGIPEALAALQWLGFLRPGLDAQLQVCSRYTPSDIATFYRRVHIMACLVAPVLQRPS